MNLAAIIDAHPPTTPRSISRGHHHLRRAAAQVAGLRGGLVGLGLEPGDRLAHLAGNNWYFVVAYLAALGAGLVVVPAQPARPRRPS